MVPMSVRSFRGRTLLALIGNGISFVFIFRRFGASADLGMPSDVRDKKLRKWR